MALLRPRTISSWSVSAVLLACAAGCTHVDVKARENLRLGPLREVRAVPVDVDHVVTVDAGTDAFTDAELTAVEAELAPALEASFAALAGNDGDKPLVRTGTARVGACKLRAGPNKRFVVYLAKCHVSVVVDGVVVAEATGEGLRRTESIFVRGKTQRPEGQERDPLVEVEESRAALIAALDVAARVLVEGPLPRAEGEPPVLGREERAALARTRLATASTSAEKVASLFDLRSSGVPSDAALAARHLDDVTMAPSRSTAPSVRGPGRNEVPADVDAPIPDRAPVIGAVPTDAPEPAQPDAAQAAPAHADPAQAAPPGTTHADAHAAQPSTRATEAPAEAVRDVAVVAAAIDAIGELCDPALKARVEAVPARSDDVIGRAKARALPRLRACAAIARPR